jgi:phage terminase large subunit
VLTAKLASVLTNTYGGRKVAMLFLDSAGIAAPVESRLRLMGFKNIVTVNFGAHSPNPRCAYMRDYMWQEMREWLRNGAIDSDPGLAADLAGPCLVSDNLQRVKLEKKELMKKRGLDSPDDADALALTFAMPVAPRRVEAPAPKPASCWS